MGWVRALAAQLVADSALADDVAQEAWLAARDMPRGAAAGEGSMRAWLAEVVRNRVRRLVRGERRRAHREEVAARPEALEATDDVVARGAVQRDLARHVMELDEPYRTALLLRYLDELSTAEVAARVGLSPVAARKRISRAVGLLRERLDREHGGDRAAWTMALATLVRTTPRVAEVASAGASSSAGVLVMYSKLFGALVVASLTLWVLVKSPFDTRSPGALGRAPRALVPDTNLAEGAGPAHTESPTEVAKHSVRRGGRALVVLDPTGAPVADSPAWVLDAAGVPLRPLRTARDGGLSIDDELADESRALLVAPPGWVPQRVALGARSDTVASLESVRLMSQARVAGRVTGLPEGHALRLTWDRMPLAFEGLQLADLDRNGVAVGVAPDGTFVCAGLDVDWSGSLLAPRGTRIVQGTRQDHVRDDVELLLLAPREDVLLELETLALVRGRCVDVRSRRPLSDLSVAGKLALGGRPGFHVVDGRTADDGTFELALPTPEGAWDGTLDLRVFGAGVQDVGFRFQGAEVGPEGELGELGIDVGRVVRFRAEGPDGRPLAGAEGRAGVGSSVSVASGPDGRGRVLGVPFDVPSLVVHCAGHAPTTVELRGDEEVLVVLRPRGGLVVTVRDARGDLAEDLWVQVLAEERAWDGPGATGWMAPEFVPPGATVERSEVEAPIPVDQGVVELPGLRPGIELTILLLNGSHDELDVRRIISPSAGTAPVRVELRAPQVGRMVTGRVVDLTGRPLPRVVVRAESEDDAQSTATDAEGRFELGPYTGSVELRYLELERPGFRTHVHEGVVLGAEASEFEAAFVLEPTRRIVVLVEDELGAHPKVDVTAAAVEVPADTPPERARVHGFIGRTPGTYVLDEAPLAAVDVRAEYAGVAREVTVPAGESSVRIVVPAAALLTVTLAPELRVARGSLLRCEWQRVEGEAVVADGLRLVDRATDGWRPVEFDLPAGTYRVRLVEWSTRRRQATPVGEPDAIEFTGGERRTVHFAGARD
jgi:RNA polymerase sigma factor (sigma-70 family)